jgi:hypothetical protein
VPAPRRCPSPTNSPWIRRWPQDGFSCATRSTKSRISSLTGGPAELIWIGPLPGDQTAVPGQQRAGGNDAVVAQLAGKYTGQGGQDRSVRPSGSRFADLTAQHRDFVAQDEDLRCPWRRQRGRTTAAS